MGESCGAGFWVLAAGFKVLGWSRFWVEYQVLGLNVLEFVLRARFAVLNLALVFELRTMNPTQHPAPRTQHHCVVT